MSAMVYMSYMVYIALIPLWGYVRTCIFLFLHFDVRA